MNVTMKMANNMAVVKRRWIIVLLFPFIIVVAVADFGVVFVVVGLIGECEMYCVFVLLLCFVLLKGWSIARYAMQQGGRWSEYLFDNG